jgi:hypothetical protein
MSTTDKTFKDVMELYDKYYEQIEYIDASDNSILKTIGIDVLTGEACGIGMRVLCDINDNAQRLISEFMGGIDCTSPGWNTSAHKSLMLTWDFIKDLRIYYLCTQYEVVIYSYGNKNSYPSIYCMTHDTWKGIQEYFRYIWNRDNTKTRIYTARGGLRNQHEFSGRIE